jgi:hypothetical protein
MPFKGALYLAGLTAALAGAALIAHPSATQTAASSASAKQPVIVELFTSEGCSSCPPADALLKRLSDSQPIDGANVIALEEHVDYWNQDGWNDPFSSRDFSERQNDYTAQLHVAGPYTPEMIVDGATEFVGNRTSQAEQTIARAAKISKATLTLQRVSNPATAQGKAIFNVQIANAPAADSSVEVWVAVTEKDLATDVKKGENAGENLKHADVVRTLHKAQTLKHAGDPVKPLTVDLKDSWKSQNTRVVVFLVDKSTRHIVGAAAASLS